MCIRLKPNCFNFSINLQFKKLMRIYCKDLFHSFIYLCVQQNDIKIDSYIYVPLKKSASK